MTSELTKITVTFKSNANYLKLLKMFVKDRLAFEAPKNHFHLIYPIDEYKILVE